MAGSVLLGYLTEFLIVGNDPNNIHSPLIQSQTIAYLFAAGIVLCAYIVVGLSNAALHTGWMMGLRIKIILTGVIYQKV